MHFGATLRILRTDAGISLRELGDRVGVSSAYLSRVENGHDAAPTPDRLRAIAHALSLPPMSLVEMSDRITPLAADYLERVPLARDLLVDIVKRQLGDVELARVKAFIDREFPLPNARARRVGNVCAGLSVERVVVGVSCTDFEDVLDVAATRLAAAIPGASPRDVSASMRDRERASSTFAGHGFAIPEAIVPGADDIAALLVLKKPLKVPTPDGLPLRVVLARAFAARGPSGLEQLVQLARVADADLAEALTQAPTARHALRVLEDAVATP